MTDLVGQRQVESREAQVEQDVVGEEGDKGFDRKADLTIMLLRPRDSHHGAHKGKDSDGSEAKSDDYCAAHPVRVAETVDATDGGGALEEEEVDQYLRGYVEREAELDGPVADVV